MKLKLVLITVLIACFAISYAQDKEYKLDSYVNPTFERKALDVEFNSLGNFSRNKETKGDDNITNYLSGNLKLGYSQIVNSANLQQTTSVGLGFEGLLNRKKSDSNSYYNDERSKERRFAVNLSVRHSSLFYKENKTFLEFSPGIDFGYNYNANESQREYVLDNRWYRVDMDITNQGPRVNAFVKLGVGVGRIENVTDARHAIYIVAELEKKGLLKRTLSNDEVNELAQLITTLKNKRHFDSRIKLAEEIEAVDAYLVENGFVEEAHSAVYFTSLYDKWMYGDRDERQAGSRFKVGISPLYDFIDIHNKYKYERFHDEKSTVIDATFGAGLYADYTNEKPLTLKLQQSVNIGLSSDWVRVRNAYSRESDDNYSDYSEKFYHNQLRTGLNLSYSLGYYANTRTYISGGIYETLRWTKKTESTAYNVGYWGRTIQPKANNLSNFTGLFVKAYYYLSPQLRAFGECNFTYRLDRQMENNINFYDKYPATNFSLGFSYAIF